MHASIRGIGAMIRNAADIRQIPRIEISIAEIPLSEKELLKAIGMAQGSLTCITARPMGRWTDRQQRNQGSIYDEISYM